MFFNHTRKVWGIRFANFFAGYIEEITFNSTASAAIIPDNLPTIISDPSSFGHKVSVAAASTLTSTSVRNRVSKIILAATFNII